ncbi:hypothetical protein WAK64_02465 [Bacillus spongiae]|uniref:Abortive phage infection protein n=1 Tax=Bacillus spongiae TaxID=2683610 RepID=A0ABU8H9J5_9BACI
MTEEQCLSVILQLRTGEIQEVEVKKEYFLTFRQLLVQQEDFKHFRGQALQGGNVLYTYTKQARS